MVLITTRGCHKDRVAGISMFVRTPRETICAALVALVAMINAANRLAVIVHQQGGSYEPGMFAATFN